MTDQYTHAVEFDANHQEELKKQLRIAWQQWRTETKDHNTKQLILHFFSETFDRWFAVNRGDSSVWITDPFFQKNDPAWHMDISEIWSLVIQSWGQIENINDLTKKLSSETAKDIAIMRKQERKNKFKVIK